jgi:hypothetical protein
VDDGIEDVDGDNDNGTILECIGMPRLSRGGNNDADDHDVSGKATTRPFEL